MVILFRSLMDSDLIQKIISTINFLKKMQDLDFQDRCDSKDCEVAIIHDKLGFCTKTFIDSEDSVIGFITPDELPELMMKVKGADNIEL